MRALVPLLLALAAWSQEPARLTFLSYNIHHAEGTDGRLDLERIAAVIRSADADLVALQEVDRNTQRTGHVDQAQQLGCLTGMTAIFARTIDYQGGLYGNTVLTRLPVNAFSNHPLPFTPGRERRGVAILEAAGPAGTPIRLLATHLDITEPDRLTAVEPVNRLAADDMPSILAGDLNALPDSRVLEGLREHWTVAGEVVPTIPVAKPARQIDYILFRPANRWRVVEVKALPEAVASDHRPIVAVLELVP